MTRAGFCEIRAELDASQLPPKKPVTAFARYIMEHKELLLKEQGLTLTDLSTKWNELSAAEKKVSQFNIHYFF